MRLKDGATGAHRGEVTSQSHMKISERSKFDLGTLTPRSMLVPLDADREMWGGMHSLDFGVRQTRM